jgi:hypothetical protein
MAYVQKGARVGRDNRAAGSPAGRENLVNQVHSPAPEPPLEIGRYDTSTSASHQCLDLAVEHDGHRHGYGTRDGGG